MVLYATQRPLYSSIPNDSSKAIPDLAVGPPEISADEQDGDGQDQAGHQVRAAGQPRGQVGGRQVRDRAGVQRQRAERLRDRATSATSSAPPRRRPRASKPISGITTPDDHDDRLQAHEAAAPRRGRRRARDADHDAGARGVRDAVRREEPLDVQPARSFTGPYMVKNDATGNLDRAGSPASRSRSSATPTGTPRPDYRPAYLDCGRRPGGQQRRDRRRAAGSCRARAWSRATARRRPQVLKQAIQSYKSQLIFSPLGRQRATSR